MLYPLIVYPVGGRYRILDGVRRYRVAHALGLGQPLCEVIPAVDEAEFAYGRFDIHGTD
jgi:ParB-like chromosome segregation protein Spo0J